MRRSAQRPIRVTRNFIVVCAARLALAACSSTSSTTAPSSRNCGVAGLADEVEAQIDKVKAAVTAVRVLMTKAVRYSP
ncbi:MAG: hypothetical protein QOJ71_1241 [Actinomycetota bacterium]|nr:hypothetical protein [Actinomycetota bacterium]